jgi:Zn-dependent protease with chaperone function
MTLYWFLLVVSSLAFGSMPAQAVPLEQSLGASSMLVGGWILLIQVAASFAARLGTSEIDGYTAARMLERQLDLFRWGGLIVSAVCLVGFKVAAAAQTWPVIDSSMCLQAIVLLSPGLLITIAVWVAEQRYGIAMGYTTWQGFRFIRELTNALLSSGGWIMLPVFAILIATDLITVAGYTNEPLAAGVTAIVAILSIPLVVPLVIRHVWDTKPIDEVYRQWIQEVTAIAGMPRLNVRVWNTRMKSSNALVAGFVPGLRNLILTDKLLHSMPRRELMLVILHEIAHIRRMHIWLRLITMIPSWILAGLVSLFLVDFPIATVACNLLAVGLTLISLRLIAHRTEYDADQWACEMALKVPASLVPPATLHESVACYAAALRRVTSNGGSDESTEKAMKKSSWLHPSIEQRCTRLQRVADRKAERSSESQICPELRVV